ncbi:hypothetical protein J5N97_020611 [Dioscorea zingiberensis]|uniref:Pentatricopeptide repeat-containing protein n=1 Tax=Dioscorea zingiberensis TaxID=325984 RepID=A0A9D5CG52_9LILI|nr:hypothetical protein J5N97_020611 [Dioscorea zingiberensis]
MRQRRVQNSGNSFENFGSGNASEEIDLLLSRNNINLENLGENDVEDEESPLPTNQEAHCGVPSSSKSKRGKGNNGHDDKDKLSNSVDNVANAIREATTSMVEVANNMMKMKSNKNLNQDFDVWAMLSDLGFIEPFFTDAYLFLLKDAKMLEAMIRCPNERRLDTTVVPSASGGSLCLVLLWNYELILFGRCIHGFYLEAGRVEWDVYLESVLVDMYAKCDSCDDVKKVLEQMSFRNVVTWRC